jgi:hypothetical protein
VLFGVEQQRVQINFNNLTPSVDFGFACAARLGASKNSATVGALSVFAFKRCP